MLRMGNGSGNRRGLNLEFMDRLGPKGDYIFAGALALLIVVALGYSIYRTFGSEPTVDIPRGDGKTHFICIECDHEVAYEPEEMRKIRRRRGEEDFLVLDCSACNGKQTMVQATFCPSCGAYYISERQKILSRLKPGEEPPERLPKEKCPECGTVRVEWIKENME
ncbi:MAG: hypothetical protein ACLFV7_07820 [Phycisphaerae bacterium]